MRKVASAGGFAPARVGAREPIGEVEELAQAAGGLSGRHRLAVRGGVAGVLHEARLDGERAADQRLEARLGEQRGQRRVVGVLQRAVVPVEPADGGLQRQPAVERRAARIGMRQRLGARGVPENVGKLGLQEGELRHGLPARRRLNPSTVVSQLAPECAMLERGEQRVELGKMGAVVGFELVDLGDAGGEGALEIERWSRNRQLISMIKLMLRPAFDRVLCFEQSC